MLVTSEHDKERARALRLLEEHGWRVDSVNKKGYVRVLCGCGIHKHWLPKTPGKRSTFRRKAAALIAECSTMADGPKQ